MIVVPAAEGPRLGLCDLWQTPCRPPGICTLRLRELSNCQCPRMFLVPRVRGARPGPPPSQEESNPMPALRQAGTEPIPGYRLLEPLGRGGFGEVWKCEAPGGLHKAVKFVQGADSALAEHAVAEQELTAL